MDTSDVTGRQYELTCPDKTTIKYGPVTLSAVPLLAGKFSSEAFANDAVSDYRIVTGNGWSWQHAQLVTGVPKGLACNWSTNPYQLITPKSAIGIINARGRYPWEIKELKQDAPGLIAFLEPIYKQLKVKPHQANRRRYSEYVEQYKSYNNLHDNERVLLEGVSLIAFCNLGNEERNRMISIAATKLKEYLRYLAAGKLSQAYESNINFHCALMVGKYRARLRTIIAKTTYEFKHWSPCDISDKHLSNEQRAHKSLLNMYKSIQGPHSLENAAASMQAWHASRGRYLS